MAEVVKLSLALGALGLRKLGEHEEVMEILKFGLSFICPDEILDSAFAILGSDEVSRQLAEVGKKVDLILEEAQSSSMQLIRDAFIAYEHRNYQDACQLFKEVRQCAFRAFNQSTTLEAAVLTTQLKIAASYMNKSYREGVGMVVFARLQQDKRSEIALTIRGYIDDLLAKALEMKREALEKAKKAVLHEKKQMEKAKAKIREIDAQVDPVLARAYPLLSQGLGLTDPSRTALRPGTDPLVFKVLPQYIPGSARRPGARDGGGHNGGATGGGAGGSDGTKEEPAVVMVASNPELVVALTRTVIEVTGPTNIGAAGSGGQDATAAAAAAAAAAVADEEEQILNWVVNDIKHQHLFKPKSKDPLELTIEPRVLAVALKGGGWSPPGGIGVEPVENGHREKLRTKETISNGRPFSTSSFLPSSPTTLSPDSLAVGRGDEDEERERRAGQRERQREGARTSIRSLLEEHKQNLPDGGGTSSSTGSTVKCSRCSLPIAAQQVHALEQFFHPDCFRCVACDRVLKTQFRNRGGLPYCQECYQVTENHPPHIIL